MVIPLHSFNNSLDMLPNWSQSVLPLNASTSEAFIYKAGKWRDSNNVTATSCGKRSLATRQLPVPVCLRVTGVEPSPAFHRDLWCKSIKTRSHRHKTALTLSRHVQLRDGQRQDVGPLFTFTKGSSHFLWVVLWLKAIVLGSMVCRSADRHAICVDLSPQKQ